VYVSILVLHRSFFILWYTSTAFLVHLAFNKPSIYALYTVAPTRKFFFMQKFFPSDKIREHNSDAYLEESHSPASLRRHPLPSVVTPHSSKHAVEEHRYLRWAHIEPPEESCNWILPCSVDAFGHTHQWVGCCYPDVPTALEAKKSLDGRSIPKKGIFTIMGYPDLD
jgi:hypothetical protein